MGKTAQRWRKSVEPYFGFLTDLGFTTIDVDDSSFWSLWVQYRSPVSAVRVSKSNEFLRCEVELIRLVDGEVPPYPIWITEERIEWTLLDNVVEVRRPDLLAEVNRQKGLGSAEVKAQLAFWSRALRQVAQDFLDGCFAPIDEAGALVRGRVAQHPQQVQVWIPSDAPPGTEVGQVEEVQTRVPPNVGVSVRRYRRGRHSDR